jgi:hypothetical protein
MVCMLHMSRLLILKERRVYSKYFMVIPKVKFQIRSKINLLGEARNRLVIKYNIVFHGNLYLTSGMMYLSLFKQNLAWNNYF